MASMDFTVAADEEIVVGVPTVIEAPASSGQFGVVFEDDGATGYFYALDFELAEAPIVAAVHIYSVEGVTDRHIRSRVQVLWATDRSEAMLLINQYPHALFDFVSRCAYSRDNYPSAPKGSAWTHHGWNDELWPGPNARHGDA